MARRVGRLPNPLIRILKKRAYQSLLLGLLSFVFATALTSLHALDWLDYRLGDWRLRRMAAPQATTAQVVTIIVDQTSLSEAQDIFGIVWPWPRQIYAYILSFCQRANAKAVAFDILYTEDSVHGVEDDQLFAAALGKKPPTVLALPLGRQIGTATQWPEGTPTPGITPILPPRLLSAWQQQTGAFPVPELSAAARILGNVATTPDRDALFRRIEPFAVFDNQIVPALGLATYFAAKPQASVTYRQGRLMIGDRKIPLSADGRVRLRFRGPTQTHRAFNATALLQSELQIAEGLVPSIDPAQLEGAYVLVGLTAPGLLDLKPTPMGRTYPGVEVHATLLDNFLANDFYAEASPLLVGLMTLILALAAAGAVRNIQRASASMIAFPLFLALPIGLAFWLDVQNIWLPVAQSMTASTVAIIAALTTNYAIEGREKRFIKGAFRQYLSPVVIERLVANPDALKLGGEEKTLSIFFSDVQGFTSISENLSPTQLTALLNEYLTAMTDIILNSGGTIDKYEGDAIIAFWNAPLDLPDHACRAVQAAMDCQAKLAEMRPDLQARYGKELFVRIGINTGPVVVGNMGSTQRFDYTFLGDAGNLAARLEGINKQFGTYVLISENTRQLLSETLPVREIARVRVVGKATPVTIYEPIPPKTDTTAFDRARELFSQAAFKDAAAAFEELAAADPVAATYRQRCHVLLQKPPASWDGVINLTEK
jgi:adenylate cyclase